MLEGSDQNAMLGVMKVSEANAALQQTLLIVSGYTIHPLLQGGEPNYMLGVIKVLEVNAATNPWVSFF